MNDYQTMSKERDKLTSLLEAAKRGDIEAMRGVATGDSLLAFRDGHRRHALHFATLSGSDAAIRWLHGEADMLNVPDENGVTPLSFAASQGKLEACTLLLELGAEARHADNKGVTPLHRCASCDSAQVTRLLIDAGCVLDAKTASGTPLHWAAGNESSDFNAGRVLVEAGANVNARDDRGLTPMVIAAASANSRAVRALADAGADVGLVVAGGATVAHVCADRGDADGLAAVLATDVGIRAACSLDAMGRTALDVSNSDSCSDLLRSKGIPGKPREEDAETVADEAPAVIDAAGAVEMKQEGNAAFKTGDFEAALAAYSEGIALDPTNKVLFSNRAAVYQSLGQQSRDPAHFLAAVHDADACIKLDPSWAKSHYRRGLALERLFDYETAAHAYWEALRLDPSNEEFQCALKKCVDAGRKNNTKK